MSYPAVAIYGQFDVTYPLDLPRDVLEVLLAIVVAEIDDGFEAKRFQLLHVFGACFV